MKKETWDSPKGKFIKTPKEMEDFFKDIEKLCRDYNLSISHEDGHGSFIIERYDDFNIEWLKSASKNY